MDQPLISVIIPAYNIEAYLGRTLDSVLAQTYPNIEVVVVDDGSKDHTGQVIDTYAAHDSRILPVHQQNGGVTCARLRGVSEAHGDWIGFVDGDDWIEPDMYQRLLKNAMDTQADISHCGYQMILPSGKIDFYHDTGALLQQNQVEGVVELLAGTVVEPGLWNKLFRKSLLESVIRENALDQSIKINEDLLMNYYLFKKASRSVFEDFCPYHYIVRQGSAANSRINQHLLEDPVKVRRIIFDDTVLMPEAHSVIANHFVRELVVLSTMSLREDANLISPIRKKARTELRQRLPGILREAIYSHKSKITALWVSIFPASYRLVHDFYAKVTGIDHKYEK